MAFEENDWVEASQGICSVTGPFREARAGFFKGLSHEGAGMDIEAKGGVRFWAQVRHVKHAVPPGFTAETWALTLGAIPKLLEELAREDEDEDEPPQEEQMISDAEKAATVHPQHYGGDVRYEVIKIVEARKLDFNLGNAFKYLARAGKKDPTKTREDLVKALFYIARTCDRGFITPPLRDEPHPTRMHETVVPECVPVAYSIDLIACGLEEMGVPAERIRILRAILRADPLEAHDMLSTLIQETPAT